MSAHQNVTPDDEREVSSGSIQQLDNILFSRHFQNNHTTQQSILPTSLNPPSSINESHNPSHTSVNTLPNPDPLITYQNSRYPINICNINIRGFNDPTKQFQFLDHCERNNFDI